MLATPGNDKSRQDTLRAGIDGERSKHIRTFLHDLRGGDDQRHPRRRITRGELFEIQLDGAVVFLLLQIDAGLQAQARGGQAHRISKPVPGEVAHLLEMFRRLVGLFLLTRFAEHERGPRGLKAAFLRRTVQQAFPGAARHAFADHGRVVPCQGAFEIVGELARQPGRDLNARERWLRQCGLAAMRALRVINPRARHGSRLGVREELVEFLASSLVRAADSFQLILRDLGLF